TFLRRQPTLVRLALRTSARKRGGIRDGGPAAKIPRPAGVPRCPHRPTRAREEPRGPGSLSRVRPAFGRTAPKNIRKRLTLPGERQGNGVQAVPLAGRWRTVGENVSEMTAAACAHLL